MSDGVHLYRNTQRASAICVLQAIRGTRVTLKIWLCLVGITDIDGVEDVGVRVYDPVLYQDANRWTRRHSSDADVYAIAQKPLWEDVSSFKVPVIMRPAVFGVISCSPYWKTVVTNEQRSEDLLEKGWCPPVMPGGFP